MPTKPDNFNKIKDPFAQREAAKYQHPIPSRELIMQLIGDNKPLTREQIAGKFALSEEDDLEALRRRLRAMERDGQLIFNRSRQYCIVSSRDLIAGRVIGHANGFGFVKPDDGTADLFLSPRQMRSLMHRDRVVVQIASVDKKGKREGVLVEVLERNTHHVAGRLVENKGLYFVVADNNKNTQDIAIPCQELSEAVAGQIVVAEIIQHPSKHKQAIGRICEVLGEHMKAGMEIEIALRSHDLPFRWPGEVNAQIAGLAATVPSSALQNREDLRQLPWVTIDGEDARDFDDAVYATATDSGWELLVAIADVAHYVPIDSPLDQEALNRSTSVYFPQRVIPMLPEVLSNGLCSLNPQVDRLALVCKMQINSDGSLGDFSFCNAVIKSIARLTYTQVAKMLAGESTTSQQNLLPHLQNLHQLYLCIARQQKQQGSMDFATQETRIIFDANSKIQQIVPTQRNDAHRLIEAFMISANTCAAKFLHRHPIPHLLRIHEPPSAEKLLALRDFLGGLGLFMGGGDKPTSKDYSVLLGQVASRADAHLVQTVLLRSMSQAVYSPQQKGHFGLALAAYAHFTSPIRRYPDLLVHRAIKHCLQGQAPQTFCYSEQDMTRLGEHCSTLERRADDASRDVVSWLKCEYMQDKIGEEFTGIISHVTGFGLFVELDNIYVEGLVHISNLPQDYFHFDAVSHRLVGERTGVRYRLGDKIEIVVAGVNLDDKKIDFGLLDAVQKPKSDKKSKPKSNKKTKPAAKNKHRR